MLNTQIYFNDNARKKIKTGIDLLANAVKSTLGPQGKCVIIKEVNKTPHVTKDGVTVAKSIQLPDMAEDTGVQLVREAALKTLNSVGDATTTSTVLAQALIDNIEHDLDNNKITNFAEYKSGIEFAAKKFSEEIKKSAKSIKDGDVEHIATISANNDSEIGKLVAEAFEKVTEDGVITVEESKDITTSIDVINGMQFDSGFLAPHFITDQAKGECVLNNPYIFLSDQKVLRTKDIVKFLEPIAREGGSILLIAEEFDNEVIENLKLNKLQNILKCCAIKAPSFGDYRKEVLEDLAILTDGSAITYDSGIEVYDVDMVHLGKAKKVIVTKDKCTIIEGAGNKENIKARANVLKEQLKNEEQNPSQQSEFIIEFLKNRIAKLIAGVCVIYVGGTTELEMKEKKDRIDDAICATRAALEEGIVPGGGINFLKLPKINADKRSMFSLGIDVVNNIRKTIFSQIIINAGLNPNDYINKIDPKKNIGFDAKTYSICNFIKKGIINPAKADRLAFENAISIALIYLLTSCAIVPCDIVQINNP